MIPRTGDTSQMSDFFCSYKVYHKYIFRSSVGGTLSTSDGNHRKSSIPVTPTLPKKNFNRPESLTVIQNNTTENNNGSSKPTKLYLEPERNQRSCRSRGMKNNYTTKNNNDSFKSNRNKPACQFNAVILEDLELAKPQ
jgi:hypothetical protein